jgi:hypothetical protein
MEDVATMDAAKASLVLLIHRYLGGLMDPFVTRTEVQKLMYFMQEAGQPLRLRYIKHHYGPHADNLRRILNDVEGHLVAGCHDGGDAAENQLELVPGAVAEAEAFLRADHEALQRFDRVGKLVEGFETPFGLELLATVHWVATREHAIDATDAAAKVYAWSERNRRFSPRQIGIAFEALGANGWWPPGSPTRSRRTRPIRIRTS